ncbi:MAG: hypothetical protein ACM3ZV_07615 [Bacillota bacterium]
MRTSLVLLPLSLCAAPALAQAAPPPAVQLPPELADPATVDRVTDAMQALSQAFLQLPVGNVQAALEGRPATAADRRRTVGTETGLNPRALQQRIADAKPKIEQSVRAVNQALPEITRNLVEAQRSIERALSNLPDPNYPRR